MHDGWWWCSTQLHNISVFSRCKGLSLKEKDHLAGYLINDDGGGGYGGCNYEGDDYDGDSDYDGDDDEEVWYSYYYSRPMHSGSPNIQ